MLALLNTIHDDWADHREDEMERLRIFLENKETLGCKLTPLHTCLPVVETVAQSRKRLLAFHISTMPFYGPMGKQIGMEFSLFGRIH